VTGGTGGIGRATAVALADRGYRLVLVGRDRARGERAARELGGRSTAGRMVFEAADLASRAQVRALAARLRSCYQRVDVLVNNAGGLYADRWLTEDGREATLATNVVNPLLLTLELLPALRARRPAGSSSSAPMPTASLGWPWTIWTRSGPTAGWTSTLGPSCCSC
jgi:retinol dehydrogenase 12